jgi:hypothetical protein
MFNIENPNPKAVTIGFERLNKLLKAAGKRNGLDDIGGDADNLGAIAGRELLVEVSIQEGKNGYPASNKIKRFNAQ